MTPRSWLRLQDDRSPVEFRLMINPQRRSVATPLCVVIPALNEAGVIGKCLGALASQSEACGLFEVVVVDNGSADNTVSIASGFQKLLKIHVLSQPGVSISALRNFGASATNSEFLAFLDADCIPPQDWVSQSLFQLRRLPGVVTGAPYRIPENSGWVATAWYGGSASHPGPVRYLPGGCILTSRRTFEALKGFDEQLETAEDYDFCRRAAECGFPVEAQPACAVVHLGTPDKVSGFYRKHLWHGKHVLRAFSKDPLAFRGGWSVVLSIVSLVLLLGIAVGFPGLVYSPENVLFLVPVAGFLGLNLALTARACQKRASARYFPHLLLLNAVYCTARALCLIGLAGEYKTARLARRQEARSV